MKKIKNIIVACMLLSQLSLLAQTPDIVEWSTSVNRINDLECELVLTGTIADGWRVYGVKEVEKGPLPTQFEFYYKDKNNGINFISYPYVIGENSITGLDPLFNVNISYFEKEVILKRKITLKTQEPFETTCYLWYMACDAVKCKPLKYVYPLTFKVN